MGPRVSRSPGLRDPESRSSQVSAGPGLRGGGPARSPPSLPAGAGAAPTDISSCRRAQPASPSRLRAREAAAAERGPGEAKRGRRAPGPAAGTTESPHGRRQRLAAAPGARRGKRRRGGGGGAMEPREVKDRILENISLSVKKVSGLFRSGPLPWPCRSPPGSPLCLGSLATDLPATPSPAREAGGSREHRGL